MQNLSHEFGVFVHFSKILAQYNVREKTALALLIINEKYLRGGSLDAVITLIKRRTGQHGWNSEGKSCQGFE